MGRRGPCPPRLRAGEAEWFYFHYRRRRVDIGRPTHFTTGIDAFTHEPVGNIFSDIDVDVAVSDIDAWMYRVGYNITLLGKIVFLNVQRTLLRSDFDPTPDGDPPSTVQEVGTARATPTAPSSSTSKKGCY